MTVTMKSLFENGKRSPLTDFPESVWLSGSTYKVNEGLYLLTTPSTGLVYGVGWAASDAWADFVWDFPTVRPRPDAHNVETNLPDLTFLGRPADLTFDSILKYECERTGRPQGILCQTEFRIPSGERITSAISGKGNDAYHFDSKNPKGDDVPVVIGIRFPRSDPS